MEALPALLGRAVVHVLRDANPVVGALLADKLEEQLVLFRDPRSATVSGGHSGCGFVSGYIVWLSGYWVLERNSGIKDLRRKAGGPKEKQSGSRRAVKNVAGSGRLTVGGEEVSWDGIAEPGSIGAEMCLPVRMT